MTKKYAYNPTLSGRENLDRVLVDAGIPEELLGDVDVQTPRASSSSEFALYPEAKLANTGMKVTYSGELAELSGKTHNVHFYDRVAPIPDVWKNKVMFVRDSDLETMDIHQYIKSRWTQDGFPFLGEQLTMDVEGTLGVLAYGRNTIKVTPSVRSFGLTGHAYQQVQYFVDLDSKQSKVVATVNPFLTQAKVTEKAGWSELAVPVGTSVANTEARLLERFMSEAYGMVRGKAVMNEVAKENLQLVRSATFKQEVTNPSTPEQQLEANAAKEYDASYLYELSKTQEEDANSLVVGNVRLMVGKSNLAKLVVDSGKFVIDANEATRFNRVYEVSEFYLRRHDTEHGRIFIQMGRFSSTQEVFERAQEVLKAYFANYLRYINFVRGETTDGRLTILIEPSIEVVDFVAGEMTVTVDYVLDDGQVETPPAPQPVPDVNVTPSNPVPTALAIKRVLAGFSGVSLADAV